MVRWRVLGWRWKPQCEGLGALFFRVELIRFGLYTPLQAIVEVQPCRGGANVEAKCRAPPLYTASFPHNSC